MKLYVHQINHIPNNGLLTNKLGLLFSLRAYERTFWQFRNRPPGLQMRDFFPETYVLDDAAERSAFFHAALMDEQPSSREMSSSVSSSTNTPTTQQSKT
ncbi:unnamed protein product, partial [Protopolystoma xenopodis]